MSMTESGLTVKKSFHHASDNSDRIQRIVKFLRSKGEKGATSLEISDACYSPRASSDVSEARACGHNIDCKYEGKSPTGRKIYRYRIYEPTTH